MQTERPPRSDRTPWRLRLRSRALLLGAIGTTLLILALAIGQAIVSQRDARTQANAGVEALLALHQLLQATVDAETGQRGYLLTGDEAYLEPYSSARREINSSLGRLGVALRASGDDDDLARFNQVTALVGEKVTELDRTVGLARTGDGAAALAIVRKNTGKRVMDELRAEVRELVANEERTRSEAFDRASGLERNLLPLMGVLGALTIGLVLLALRAEQRRSAAEAEAAQAGALRAANERANLLASELNHRVKNLFSTTLTIVSLSARKRAPLDEVIEDIRDRILALSRAHIASQGGDSEGTTGLETVIAGTLQPYADGSGERVAIAGPQVEIPVRMVTPLGLIFHELATNAAKYGAFSADDGTVELTWETVEEPEGIPRVRLVWREKGGPPMRADGERPVSAGFGTRMIDLAADQLGGTIDRRWPASGAVVRLEFPVN
jgi:two-component sensor histidine kinase